MNAYSTGMFFGGLEMMDVKELQTATTSSLSTSQGLIDCGATASAGPLVAVESLIGSILAKDSRASIDVRQAARPYFRFGNGQWGRALFQVCVTSNVSGSPRSFQLFALPNPPELHHPNFDRSTLVPILIGMDFLGDAHCGLCIDFPTGLALNTQGDSDAFQLSANQKGHFVLDIVEYLTLGHSFHDGHATVCISAQVQVDQLHTLQSIEFHAVEYFDLTVSDVTTRGQSRQQAIHRLHRLREIRQQRCRMTSAVTVSMNDRVNDSPNSNQDLSVSTHGVLQAEDLQCRSGRACEPSKSCNTQQESHGTLGPAEEARHGSSRSSLQGGAMAVLRSALGSQAEVEPARAMGSLSDVCTSTELCPSPRCSRTDHQVRESNHGTSHAQGDVHFDRRSSPNCRALSCSPSQDRCGGNHEHNGGQGHQLQAETCECKVPGREQGEEQAQDISYGKLGLFVGHADCKPRPGKPQHGGPGDSPHTRGESRDCRHDPTSQVHGGPRGLQRDAMRLPRTQPLSSKMASRLMAMTASLVSLMATTTLDFCLDGRDGIWEVACSPHSWLSQACEQQGLKPRRINLNTGFDLYRPQAWEDLKTLRRKTKPRKIWLSLPCTKWCQWTYMNYKTEERKEILRHYQRRERRMLWSMNDFVKDAISEDPECQIYYEWVFPCRGWQEPPMLDLQDFLNNSGVPWLDCRVDGCRYDLKDSKNENFLRKRWLIKTTDEHFHQNYKTKVCLGNHTHSWIQGVETSRSAYYPWKLCESIARFWRQQLLPDRQMRNLFSKEDFVDRYPVDGFVIHEEEAMDFSALGLLAAASSSAPMESALSPPDSVEIQPTQQERAQWQAKISKYHRAAGHPTNRNLARLVKNAGQPQWKIDDVLHYKCPACEAIRPGGMSSKAIPPASTAPFFKAWQAVGLDTFEWKIPGTKLKMKALLMLDLATKVRAVSYIKTYENLTMEAESAEDLIKGFSEGWLAHYPKPALVIMDSATTFDSAKFWNFINGLNIAQHFPADKEPWANGMVEAAVHDVKHTATAIHLEALDQEPLVSMFLAVASLNATEFTAGYSAFQWAFGSQYSLDDEDFRTFHQLDSVSDYQRLVQARQQAETIAVKTKSQRILSKLSNTIVRQPLQEYKPMDLVKVWRKYQPADQHTGKRGGFKKALRPHWIGPGRVVFSEVIPRQEEGDPRRHVLWVLIGKRLLRCSVHSVRLATEPEKLEHDLTSDENPASWKDLSDIIPKREFLDITDEVPGPAEIEIPDLPYQPDDTTMVPLRRAQGKTTYGKEQYRHVHRSSPLDIGPARQPRVQHFVPPAPASPSYAPTTPLQDVGSDDGAIPDAVNEYEDHREVVDDTAVEPSHLKYPRL